MTGKEKDGSTYVLAGENGFNMFFNGVGGKAVFGGIVSENGAVRVVSDCNC